MSSKIIFPISWCGIFASKYCWLEIVSTSRPKFKILITWLFVSDIFSFLSTIFNKVLLLASFFEYLIALLISVWLLIPFKNWYCFKNSSDWLVAKRFVWITCFRCSSIEFAISIPNNLGSELDCLTFSAISFWLISFNGSIIDVKYLEDLKTIYF